MRHTIQHLLRPALGILLAAGLSLPLQANPFEALAGPGEKLTISANRHPDGEPGTIRNIIDEEGEVEGFIAIGSPVILESPRLYLRALRVDYDAENGVLEARGEVHLRQEGVDARSEELLYNVTTGEVTLIGEPEVERLEGGQYSHFHGMEELILIPGEDGATEIRLLRGEIHCDFLPADQAPEELRAAHAQAAEGREQADEEGSAGLGAFGDELRITTRERGDEDPAVMINASGEGELILFRAEGAVELEGDDLYLTSHVLEFDGPRERLEALHNVFVRREAIEADAGRLQYDLPTETITLTINPVVRLDQATQYLVISNLDMYRIVRNPDGTTTTDAFGDRPTYEFEEKADPPTEPGETEPREIDLDDVEALEGLN